MNNKKTQIIQFKEDAPASLSLVLPLFITLCLIYLIWRFAFTVNWFIWFALPLFILEIYNFLNTTFFLITTRKIVYPKWLPPLKNVTVDIFIPTYNEPKEIVEMTTIRALRVRGVNKVFVLDDGNREEIKTMSESHGATYLARGDNTHAKAGNLNHGLKYSKADFIINLDCDHVPEPFFIERTLGYFADPKLGFIQTPQLFYNQDSFQHQETQDRTLWNEQTMFYESIQPGKNLYNAAFFCGSGALIRRKALDSVDGYATGTATEDIHTSIRLHSKGWKSLFVPEGLAFGLAAEDLREYHKQRVRWGAGSIGLLFRSPDSPLWIKNLSLMQRLCYINSAMAYMEGTLKLLYFAIPLYVIFSNQNLVNINILAYFGTYLPFLFLSYFITYYFSRRTYHFPNTEIFNIINIFSHISSLKGLIKLQKKFGVSLKVKVSKQSAIIYPGLLFLAGILLLGDIYGLYLLLSQKELLSNSLLIGIFWNSFNLIFVLAGIYYLYKFNLTEKQDYKFCLDLPINFAEKTFAGKIKRISLVGAVIETPSKFKESEKVVFDLNLSNQVLTLKATIKGIKKKEDLNQINVNFDQLSEKQRVLLTGLFFNTLVPELFSGDFKNPQESFQYIPKINKAALA